MLSAKLIAFAAASVSAAVFASNGLASPPTHVRLPLSITDKSQEYSDACGFDVYLSANGIVDVTFHTNPDGSILEQDMFPGLTITVSSAHGSFDHVFGPTTYRYPDGVYVGAPAVITEVGVRGDAPGIPPDAGRRVTPGLVMDVVPDLGPITIPTGPPVSQTGHFEDHATILAAICAALT
jgi:hypothetical protein